MTYRLIWSEGAKKDLQKLGKAEYVRIVRKVESHLLKNPLALGKPLGGNLSSLYRYRIGDYRVVYSIIKGELLVMVVRVGHRKDVYD